MLTDDENKERLKKQAEEDKKRFEREQKTRQKNELQLKLSNFKQEFQRIENNFKNEEMKLRGIKSSIDVLNRGIVEGRGKVQKQDRDVISFKNQLEKAKQELERMQLDQNNNQHWHKVYTSPLDVIKESMKKHLQGFPVIAKDIEGTGIEIINCSPNSAIQCFRKANIWEVLK